jgi:transcriptional regulator with XRE-family HTH domain
MLGFADLGKRLRAHRAAAKLTADEVASRVGVSRALLYRYESGEIIKLATLEKLAGIYGTSAASLVGLGNEYLTSGPAFFERITRLEEEADHITTVFGPLLYVLTSDAYEQALAQALTDPGDDGEAFSALEAQRLIRTLRRRKELFRTRKPSLVNIVPVAEIERYLGVGLSAQTNLPSSERTARRRAAAREMEHLAELIANPPMGIQIALTRRPLPTAGFQMLRIGERRVLAHSPFRIGHPLNLRYGVAMITEDEVALRLHETLAARLWETGLTGAKALDEIQKQLKGSRS